jgi:DNA/RNA endonuclease G (NUC1)
VYNFEAVTYYIFLPLKHGLFFNNILLTLNKPYRMKKIILLIFLLPFFSKAQDTITIRHQRYTTTFNERLHYPVLVHWIVKSSDLCGTHDPRRVNREHASFTRDPSLPDYTNLQHYYSNNTGGYQRGHNMDAADNSCDLQQMKECFYFSNMTPQTSELNEDTWGDLEDYTRHMARQYGKVEVWCGSYGNSGILMGAVTVPAFCWKIIRYNGQAEAYIFPNTHSVNNFIFQNYKKTVAVIRTASHLPLNGL